MQYSRPLIIQATKPFSYVQLTEDNPFGFWLLAVLVKLVFHRPSDIGVATSFDDCAKEEYITARDFGRNHTGSGPRTVRFDMTH